MRRPTSLREQPESSNAKARLRRSSNRSALPFSLGIGVLLLNTYYCIIYAEINRFVHEDNGQKWMTAADVAALTSVDTRTVRRWCEARAQLQSEFPIPFFRMNGLLRFERAKIEAW